MPKTHIPASVLRLAEGQPINLSIRQLRAFTMDRNNLLGVAQHLRNQVPIRLARRVVELDHVFSKLRTHPNLHTVQAAYLRSLEAILAQKSPETDEEAHTFAKYINTVLNGTEMTKTIEKLCTIVQELQSGFTEHELEKAEGLLHNFYTSRLSTRMVIEQFLQMAEGQEGLIRQCCPHTVVQNCVDEADQICLLVYGARPTFEVTGDTDFNFLHMPGIMHLIVKEILKNACRATMEHSADPDEHPIRIHITAGKDDLVIRVSDEGGGFPRALLPKVFSYVYTTVKRVSGAESPYLNLAGYGRGLPLARLYCTYFGGTLYLLPIHGAGTDCYIYISRNLDYTSSPISISTP